MPAVNHGQGGQSAIPPIGRSAAPPDPVGAMPTTRTSVPCTLVGGPAAARSSPPGFSIEHGVLHDAPALRFQAKSLQASWRGHRGDVDGLPGPAAETAAIATQANLPPPRCPSRHDHPAVPSLIGGGCTRPRRSPGMVLACDVHSLHARRHPAAAPSGAAHPDVASTRRHAKPCHPGWPGSGQTDDVG